MDTTSPLINFLIVIPAHNEAQSILLCLDSLKRQRFPHFECVVVNDGSTDATPQIVKDFIERENEAGKTSRFTLVHREPSARDVGAKVVRAFNFGLASENMNDFEVLCKFDADIIFPEDYLEKVAEVYLNNKVAGMVGGLVYVKDKNDHWQHEKISSKQHLRGPIKTYRRQCFIAMEGLRPVLGWDNIDVMLAQMYGWQVVVLQDLWVKHLRPTGFAYRKERATKMGRYFYNIGLSFPLAVLSAAKLAYQNTSGLLFIQIIKTFIKQRAPRELSQKEINYIRNLRWKQILHLR